MAVKNIAVSELCQNAHGAGAAGAGPPPIKFSPMTISLASWACASAPERVLVAHLPDQLTDFLR